MIWLIPWAGNMNQIQLALWLPAQAGKMLLSWLLRITHCVPQFKKIVLFIRIINPLLDQASSDKMAGPQGCTLAVLLFYHPKTHKKITWPISSHLDLTLGQKSNNKLNGKQKTTAALFILSYIANIVSGNSDYINNICVYFSQGTLKIWGGVEDGKTKQNFPLSLLLNLSFNADGSAIAIMVNTLDFDWVKC